LINKVAASEGGGVTWGLEAMIRLKKKKRKTGNWEGLGGGGFVGWGVGGWGGKKIIKKQRPLPVGDLATEITAKKGKDMEEPNSLGSKKGKD